MARLNATGSGVNVDGLPQLVRALKEIDPALVKELRQANLSVAKFVADDARAGALALGSTAAKVAPSVKASAGAGYAGVALGGPGYPMAAGAEFGSYRYKQFQPWRGNGSDAGYFLYPAIRQDADRIETEYKWAADEVIRKAGLD